MVTAFSIPGLLEVFSKPQLESSSQGSIAPARKLSSVVIQSSNAGKPLSVCKVSFFRCRNRLSSLFNSLKECSSEDFSLSLQGGLALGGSVFLHAELTS